MIDAVVDFSLSLRFEQSLITTEMKSVCKSKINYSVQSIKLKIASSTSDERVKAKLL